MDCPWNSSVAPGCLPMLEIILGAKVAYGYQTSNNTLFYKYLCSVLLDFNLSTLFVLSNPCNLLESRVLKGRKECSSYFSPLF